MTQEKDAIAILTENLTNYFYEKLHIPMFGNEKDVKLKKIDLDAVKFSLLTIEYEDTKNFPVTPDLLFEKEIDNPTDATIHSRFEKTSESIDTFKWSVTEGLKLGASATFKVGVPIIGEGKSTLSAEVSLGAGQESTKTVTEKWTVGDVIDVPPRHSIRANFILNKAKPDTPFVAFVEAHGRCRYLTDPAPFGGTDGFWADLDDGVQWPTRPDWQGLPILPDESARKFEARGIFSGAIGLRARVVTSKLAELA